MERSLSDDLKKKAKELERFLGDDALDIIGVEALNHFEESFENEGFTDSTLEKWKPRKTTDKKGRDLTRYRTSNRGKRGSLTKKGRQDKGRQILTGHGSGGNKLRNSGRTEIVKDGVNLIWDKDYAEVHNEGEGNMPKRQFAGASKQLDKKIKKKIDKELRKILK